MNYSPHVIRTSQQVRERQEISSPSYPLYLIDLIRTKISSRLPSDRRLFKKLNNEHKKEIRKFIQTNFDKYLENLTTDDTSLWRHTNRLFKNHEVSVPLRKYDGSWAVTGCEKFSLINP